MRILIVGINFYPEMISTGKYTGEMAVFLSQTGHQVRMVTAPPYYPQWKVQPGYKAWRYKVETWQGVGVYRCPLWVPRQPSGLKRLIHLFSFTISSLPVLFLQMFWKPGMVLCIAPTMMNAPFAWMVARFSGAKAWLHLQDFELDAAGSLGILPANPLLRKPVGWGERWLLRRFDRVSTISSRMMERLASKGVVPDRTVLFPNWVDTTLIHPLAVADTSLKEEFSLSGDKIIVLYAGNMGSKQGLEIIIEAARKLQAQPGILFVFCGQGAIRQDLEIAAKDLANIQFMPLQPVERFNDLLNMADIHILPQRADAADLVMPSKLSGMLASGKAVIATANPGTEVARVVGEVGVVVPPANAPALAEAILHLAQDPLLRRSLGQKGLSWVLANWSKDKVFASFSVNVESMLHDQEGSKNEG